jgi:hypothetical protein
MALAMIYTEPEKGGRGKVRQNGTENLRFSKQRLSQARAVLRYSPELAKLKSEKFADLSSMTSTASASCHDRRRRTP